MPGSVDLDPGTCPMTTVALRQRGHFDKELAINLPLRGVPLQQRFEPDYLDKPPRARPPLGLSGEASVASLISNPIIVQVS
jgi:hypothetical protein